jgi:hypothetical protein
MQGLLLGKPDIEPSVKMAARESYLSAHEKQQKTVLLYPQVVSTSK